MPPPEAELPVAVLPLMRESFTVKVPRLKRPPPFAPVPGVELFETVTPFRVKVPALPMPPPSDAVLLLTLTLVMVTVEPAVTNRPPPGPMDLPPWMVMPEIVTWLGVTDPTSKTCVALLPLTARLLAPGPVIVM